MMHCHPQKSSHLQITAEHLHIIVIRPSHFVNYTASEVTTGYRMGAKQEISEIQMNCQ